MADFLKKVLKHSNAMVAEAVASLDRKSVLYVGDPALDWAINGWANGRLNLIYGPNKSGKSALSILGAAALQREDPDAWVVIWDSEYYYYKDPLNVQRLITFGLNLDRVLIISDNKIGSAFSCLADLEADVKWGEKEDKKTGKITKVPPKMKVCAMIVDSWGGFQSDQAEAKIEKNEAETAGESFGGNAKYINPIIGQLLRIMAENDITGFHVQHCIKNMDKYGDRWVLLGGERLKFLAHRILFMEGSAAADSKLIDGDEQNAKKDGEITFVGKKVLGRCEKSRGVVEGRKCEFWINFVDARFARPEHSLFTLASNLGVLFHPQNAEGKANQAWWAYSMDGKVFKANGANKFAELIAGDKNLFNHIFHACKTSKNSSGTTAELSEVVVTEEEGETNVA